MNGKERNVVVVVPVYNGKEHLAKLFDTLFKHTPQEYARFLVVDFCKNIGFVKTVNRALRHAVGSHFVLLNSDTEVPDNWLPRLMEPIFVDPDHVATVTPFSNGATFVSLPVADDDNRGFLQQYGLAQIDGALQKLDVPACCRSGFLGHGFCMAMNANAIARCGLFDEARFGRGYGEEVEWCLRALRAGFVHCYATNVYVAHYHCGSFATEEKARLCREHGQLIRRDYPEVIRLQDDFLRTVRPVWDSFGDVLVRELESQSTEPRIPRALLVVPELVESEPARRFLRCFGTDRAKVNLKRRGFCQLW